MVPTQKQYLVEITHKTRYFFKQGAKDREYLQIFQLQHDF